MPVRAGLLVVALTAALDALLGAEAAFAARTVVDRNYQCTILASTRQFPNGLFADGEPQLNAWGQSVFRTRSLPLGNFGNELRVGRGEVVSGQLQTHVVATASLDPLIDELSSIDRHAIDDSARVTYLASVHPDGVGPFGQGIFRVFTNNPSAFVPAPRHATPEIDPASPHTTFSTFVLDENANGQFLFESDALYRSESEIARRNTPPLQDYSEPVLHRLQPWTAFIGTFDTAPFESRVWVNGFPRAIPPFDPASFHGLSISGNASPFIAVIRSQSLGIDSWELVAEGPAATAVWVDADEDPFGALPPLQTSLNPYGDPITLAYCQDSFCVNDPIGGPPDDCTGMPNGTVCNDGDPDTISSCTSGVCVGMPLPAPEPQSTAPILLFAAGLFGRLARMRRAKARRDA